jgi:L-rhamnose mutarotase
MEYETLAFRMQLKPGMAEEYRRRHDEIWPELTSLLRDAGISDYRIFLDPATGALFATLKLRPDNRRETLPRQPLMRRWWDHMADIMEVEPDNRPSEWPLQPMFHLP